MVKTTPLPFKNKSSFLHTAYAHLYTTVGNIHVTDRQRRKSSSNSSSESDEMNQREMKEEKSNEKNIQKRNEKSLDTKENKGSEKKDKTNGKELNGKHEGEENESNENSKTLNGSSSNATTNNSSNNTSSNGSSNNSNESTTPSKGKKKSKPSEWPHIWLFGSLALNEENAFCVDAGNCFKFNWDQGDWEKQQVDLDPRYQFASCQFGNKILLHGGFSNYTKNELLSTIQIFDMETKTLENIPTNLSLACHSGTFHKLSNSFIIFGGKSKQQGKSTKKSLHTFSLDKREWEVIEAKGSEEPEERYGHSLVLYGDNILVLFGGKNKNDELLNDLWFFDLNTKLWEHIQDTVGDIPHGRHFHYALRHHHTMYILGGEEPEDADENNHPLYALDLKTRHWDALRVTGRLNTRRIGVSMALFSNDLIGESIVAFGGMVKTRRQIRTSEGKKMDVTVPLSNEMFHITSIPQYKLKRKLESLGDSAFLKPKKRQKITPRKLVAAFVDEDWILARILKSLDDGTYELEDAQAMTEDNEEEKTAEEPPKTYIVHGDNIARLSATLKDHIPLPRGTKVLALYPGTSCLYPGVIEDHGDESYYVLFEDDEEDGETPLREIGYKLLCPYQEEM